MAIQQLMGRYFRLKQELEIAYRMKPWRSGMIDRLANELSAVERDLVSMRAEQR